MRARAVSVALVGAALLGALQGAAGLVTNANASGTGAAQTGSGAAVPPTGSPLAGLTQARIAVGALEGQASSAGALRQLRSVEADLAAAVVPALWIDASHAIAPPYGAAVFAHSRAALLGLEHVPSPAVPASGVSGVVRSVLAADRSLAVAAIRQAAGGVGGLIFKATGMILSGDRWAATSRVDLGAVQYGAAWREALEALRELVELRASVVPALSLAHGAENALGRAAVAPAGVRALSGRAPLSRDGKPEVLFVGTESCRFCAVERWGLVAALSQFGSFALLHLSQSATTDPPIVRSFTFHGSTYASPWVSFHAVELTSSVPRRGGGYQPLDRVTARQRALVRALDPVGTVPFVDVANRFADVGATVSPDPLSGLPWGALSVALRRAKTPTGQAIAATAEVLTAEICQATGGTPAPVCDLPAVHDYTRRLAQFRGRGGGCPGSAILKRRP
jgi:Domain of unknown function (DUF929)